MNKQLCIIIREFKELEAIRVMVNIYPQTKPIVYLELLAACVIFILIIFTLPENLTWSLRSTIGITGASVWLWVLEPIPLALTSLLVIVALPIHS